MDVVMAGLSIQSAGLGWKLNQRLEIAALV
jgi:hypothetical protein